MNEPTQRKSLADAVYEELRDLIVAGKIEAGAPLPGERELRDLLGVNRGSLREGLKRLDQARLVKIRQGGSTLVLDYRETAGMSLLETLLLSPDGRLRTQVARSVVEMRAALAPDIARLAAERRGPGTVTRLSNTIGWMEEEAEDVASVQRLALLFWDAVVDGSDNIAYRLAFNSLREGYERFMDLLTEVLREELLDIPSYKAIARAIEQRDGAKAEAITRELMARGTERMNRLFEVLSLSTGEQQIA